MTGTKTVAERLREIKGASLPCDGEILAFALGRKLDCPIEENCSNCIRQLASQLADAIEAEQAELRKQSGVDVDALLKLADEIDLKANKIVEMGNSVAKAHGKDVNCIVTYPRATMEEWSNAIRVAVECANASKPQLPEGIEWPRFVDGELVKFGDAYENAQGNKADVQRIMFTANGFKINRGQKRNVFQAYGEPVKRPEPDTLESIFSEMVSVIESDGCVDLTHYVERYRKLKGGE